MLNKIKQALGKPFRWGFEAIDTRPSGAAYRRTTKQLTAVEGDQPGVIALVVGKGKVANMPVVATIQANDAIEAANATLQFVQKLRRSQAGAINKVSRNIDREVAGVAKAAKAALAAERKASGNEAGASPGMTTQSTDAPGSALGERPLMVGT